LHPNSTQAKPVNRDHNEPLARAGKKCSAEDNFWPQRVPWSPLAVERKKNLGFAPAIQVDRYWSKLCVELLDT
jgi:hypothetical protein